MGVWIERIHSTDIQHIVCKGLKESESVSSSVTSDSLPMDCSPPVLCPWKSLGENTVRGSLSLLQGIFPRNQTWVSCIAGRFFTIWATSEAHVKHTGAYKKKWSEASWIHKSGTQQNHLHKEISSLDFSSRNNLYSSHTHSSLCVLPCSTYHCLLHM